MPVSSGLKAGARMSGARRSASGTVTGGVSTGAAWSAVSSAEADSGDASARDATISNGMRRPAGTRGGASACVRGGISDETPAVTPSAS